MLKLAVKKREVFGKKLRAVRVAGELPVVIYGPKEPPVNFFVSAKEFKKVFAVAGESAMVSLQSESDDRSWDVLIHDVARHPVTDEPLHVDFYVVDKTKTVEVAVPLRSEGVAPAVKDLGGTLVSVLRELKIEALPMKIPHDIPVDVSALATLESQVLVKDLKVPSGVRVLNDPEAVVVSISVAKEEPVEEAPVDLSAIEVEKKGKKEEGEGTGAATEAPPTPAKGKGGEKK